MKIINSQLMESTKVSFGYHSDLGGYMTSMRDLSKLGEISIHMLKFLKENGTEENNSNNTPYLCVYNFSFSKREGKNDMDIR